MKSKICRFVFIASLISAALFCLVACKDANIKFVLSFDSNGGTECASIRSDDVETLKMPSDPTRENYVFDGWFWDDGTWEKPFTINSILDQPISEYMDMTVYAKWKGADISVTLESEASVTTETVEYGKNFTLPVPERYGYVFRGWYVKDDPNKTAVTDSRGKSLGSCDFSSAVLAAEWIKPTYTVKFSSGAADAKGQMSAQSFNYCDETPLGANAYTRVGYTFAGWKKSGSDRIYPDRAVENWTDRDGETVELTAEWKPISYRVYFKKSETASKSDSPYVDLTYDAPSVLTTPRNFYKTGYTLDGWACTDKSGKTDTYRLSPNVKNLSSTDGDELEFVAQWQPIKYTVEYRTDSSASYKVVKSEEIEYDRTFTVLDLEKWVKKEGYAFTEWKLYGMDVKDEYNGKTFAVGEQLTNVTERKDVRVILAPVWKPVKYKVNLLFGDGTDGAVSVEKTYGEDLTVSLDEYPTARDDYALRGFRIGNNFESLTKDNTGKIISIKLDRDYCNVQNGNADLYPLWLYNYDGKGTSQSPYIVDSPAAMESMAVAAYLSQITSYGDYTIPACFSFTADIDMTGRTFTPIGVYRNGQFTGVIEGNGHTVTALDIRLPEDIRSFDNFAFVCDNHGTIRNIRFVNGTLSASMDCAQTNVGFVTAAMNGASVANVALDNCTLDVTNSGKITVGAFQATNSGGTILENCYFKGVMNVASQSDVRIGLISSYNGRMTACAARAQVNVSAAKKVSFLSVAGSGDMNTCYSMFDATVVGETIQVSKHDGTTDNIFYSDISTLTYNDTPYDLSGSARVADADLKNPEWVNEHLPAMRTTNWTMENGYPELGARTLQTITVSTQEQFLELSGKALVEKYVLACDVDLTDKTWIAPSVYGEFDGGGHKITGYTYANAEGTSAGLFRINLGVIKNLELKNATLAVMGSSEHIYVGGIVAQNNGTIAYCKTSGTFTAHATNCSAYVGGIAALNSGKIYCCYSDCEIDANAVYVKNTGSSVSAKLPYAYAFGISYNDKGTAESCYSLGEIKAKAENNASSGYAEKVFIGGVANTAAKSFSIANLTYNTTAYAKSVWAVAEGLQACSGQTVNGVAQSGTAEIFFKTESYLTGTLGLVKYVDGATLTDNVFAAWKFSANAFPTLYFE